MSTENPVNSKNPFNFIKAKCAFTIILGDNMEIGLLVNARPMFDGLEYENEEATMRDIDLATMLLQRQILQAGIAAEVAAVINVKKITGQSPKALYNLGVPSGIRLQ